MTFLGKTDHVYFRSTNYSYKSCYVNYKGSDVSAALTLRFWENRENLKRIFSASINFQSVNEGNLDICEVWTVHAVCQWTSKLYAYGSRVKQFNTNLLWKDFLAWITLLGFIQPWKAFSLGAKLNLNICPVASGLYDKMAAFIKQTSGCCLLSVCDGEGCDHSEGQLPMLEPAWQL